MADKIEGGFSLATKVILGKELSGISKYREWLRQRVVKISDVQSALGKGTAHLPDYAFFAYLPKTRVVAYEDMALAEKRALASVPDDATLSSLIPEIKKIAYFVPSFAEGKNFDVKNSVAYLDCMSVSDAFDPFRTKNSAYIYQTLDVENAFGSYYAANSNCLIHCYTAINLQRCFEMDTAKNCQDSLFCHNVENLDHCMFCFNVKSKRYAIGNAEVGRENYMKALAIVQKEIVERLERSGKLDFDIYDVLAKRK